MENKKILATTGIVAGIAGIIGGAYITNKKYKLRDHMADTNEEISADDMRTYYRKKKEIYKQVGDGESPFIS